MKIIIKSFHKAQKFMDTEPFDWSISIIAEDEDRCPKRGDNHLLMRFDDAEVASVEKDGTTYYGPSEQHAQEILDFSNQLEPDDIVLIHCTAGKSRSTAAAIGVFVLHGKSPEEALAATIEARRNEGGSIVLPNRLLIRHFDKLLNQDGKLISVIDDFYTHLSNTIPLELISRGRHQIDD